MVLCFVASSLSFMDSCNFELENVCGMIQGSGDSADWRRLSRVPGGPESDHSNMGQCAGTGGAPLALPFARKDWDLLSLTPT